MKQTLTISIRISPALRAALDRIAAAEKRTAGQLGRILIEEALEARAKAKPQRKPPQPRKPAGR